MTADLQAIHIPSGEDGDVISKRHPGTLLAGVAVASFASLLLELALTRLFSVVLFYHFAFLAISIALLGLGAGGVVAYLSRQWLELWDLHPLGWVITTANGAAIVAMLVIVLHMRVSLTLGWHNVARLTVVYLAAAVPFFFTGLLFSVVFARETSLTPQLYGADLTGGALACLAVVALLDFIGGPNTVVFAAFAMAVASVFWAATPRQRRFGISFACMLVGLIAANHSGRLIDITYAKGARRSQPLFAKWNAISRVEVDGEGNSRFIVIDADASTQIMDVDPTKPWQEIRSKGAFNLQPSAPSVVNVLRPHGTYAIIGPGGGIDVARAISHGSPSVTGIEINPIIANTIMRERYAGYSYHIYQLSQVKIHVSDGRSWLRASGDKYDVIQMTLVDTWASTAAGAFALSENNLYTVEAFREYFDHLTPDGIIAIARWEFREPREALRVMVQEMATLQRLGIADTWRNFIVVSNGQLNEDGRLVTVLAKKKPFSKDEIELLRAYVASDRALTEIYLPDYLVGNETAPAQNPAQACAFGVYSPTCPPGVEAFRALAGSTRPQEFIAAYPYNITAVDDDSPFFFFDFKIRQALSDLLHGTTRGIDWKNNLGVVVLALVLFISIAAVAVFLLAPMVLRGAARGQPLLLLSYFVVVGLGYIMVEIGLIQRFVLFLGHPTYALTVVVFLLLLSSGVGSVVSRRWMAPLTRVRGLLAIIVIIVAIYIAVLPRMLASLVGLPFTAKLFLSSALLVPLGFMMGMPFPTGLRALGSHREFSRVISARGATIEWAWAMNAASGVLGSVLAMVVAIHFGLSVVLAFAATAYALAGLLTVTWRIPAAA